MLRVALLTLLASSLCAGYAQPDTLFVLEHGTTVGYAVVYPTRPNLEQFTLVGRYAMDTSRVAVRLDHKRGKPCGVYRAFYPDGAPMIFAVYGWGYLEGDWTEYAQNGRITIKGRYRNGKRDGTWAFRDQGIIGRYKDGRKHGKWKFYENDRLVRIERYRDGERIPANPSPLR